MSAYVRSKRRPPKGHECDMTLGTGADKLGHPVILSCHDAATVELKGGPFAFETWVCEKHAATLLAKQSLATEHAKPISGEAEQVGD